MSYLTVEATYIVLAKRHSMYKNNVIRFLSFLENVESVYISKQFTISFPVQKYFDQHLVYVYVLCKFRNTYTEVLY